MSSHGDEMEDLIYAPTDGMKNSITKKLDTENELQYNCHNYLMHKCIFLQGNAQYLVVFKIQCCLWE